MRCSQSLQKWLEGGTKSWWVNIDPEKGAELAEMVTRIRKPPVPDKNSPPDFDGRSATGCDGETFDLRYRLGGRLVSDSWWGSAPKGWEIVDEIIEKLQGLAGGRWEDPNDYP